MTEIQILDPSNAAWQWGTWAGDSRIRTWRPDPTPPLRLLHDPDAWADRPPIAWGVALVNATGTERAVLASTDDRLIVEIWERLYGG